MHGHLRNILSIRPLIGAQIRIIWEKGENIIRNIKNNLRINLIE